jgi:hypothetical protein
VKETDAMADALRKPCTIQGAICARESARGVQLAISPVEATSTPHENSLFFWKGDKKEYATRQGQP